MAAICRRKRSDLTYGSWFFFLLGTILSASAFGQNGPPEPTIKTNVRQVLVPVIVTDKSGRYVTDLGRDDFTVLEDGAPQKIVAFCRSPVSSLSAQPDELSPGQAATVARGARVNQSPSRTYLICLDMLHSAFENFAQVGRALQKFFAQDQPGD